MQRLVALLVFAAPVPGSVITNAWINGVGTDVVTASARAYYNPCGFSACTSDPGFISASADITGLTLGPVRPGFIEISGNGDGEYGAGSASIGEYNFLCGEVCPLAGPVMMPFALGVPFEIDVSADAMILGRNDGAGVIDFQFSLFEVNPVAASYAGASVIVYDASAVAVPEPASFSAVALGLILIAASTRRKSRAWRNRPTVHVDSPK